jgi:cyclohexadienyl dehydratase
VARQRFRLATLVAIPDNAAVPEALREGRVDAAISDSLEAPLWLAKLPGHVALGPFTRDRKAYLVRAELPELAAELDAWLLAREADGTLARLRGEQLGEGAGPPVATPLRALLAACDERLALMPLVGAAKRREGLPLEAPEREAVVLEAALDAARRAAAAQRRPPPPEAPLRRLFEALFDAAKELQWASVQAGDVGEDEPLPDLEAALRPALLRIGDRIARLLPALPRELECEAVRAAAQGELRAPRLSEHSKLALADAVCALGAAP